MRKRPSNPLSIVTALLVVSMVFAGCAKKEQPAPQAVPKKPGPAAAKPAASPVQKQVSSAKTAADTTTLFDFAAKKDPFKPYASEPAPTKPVIRVASEKTEDLLPIQRYEVSKFKLSGIIIGLKENTAMVVDPTGKGYVVKEGMPIGNNNGRITRISRTAIEVTEQFREDNGRVRKRAVILALPQKK